MVTDKEALSRAVVGPNNLVVIKHDVHVGDKSARLAANRPSPTNGGRNGCVTATSGAPITRTAVSPTPMITASTIARCTIRPASSNLSAPLAPATIGVVA